MVSFAVDEKMSREKQVALKLALNVACELTGSDGGSIMLIEGDDLVIRAYRSSDATIDASQKIGISIKIGERVAGRCAQTGETIIIVGDINKDKRFAGIQKFHEIKSGASVAIKDDSKMKGVINIHRVKSTAPITNDDTDVVSIVGKNLAGIV